MMTDEELAKYLPKYLTAENYEALIKELKNFPYNIDKRMYSPLRENILYQGDGIKNMPIIDLSDVGKGIKELPCLILSNTCDMELSNERKFDSSILYAPIINLDKYIHTLKYKNIENYKINDHISDIKKQRLSKIIFLPSNSQIDDSIVFLDRIMSIRNDYIKRKDIDTKRLFSLSDYGFYMLIFKLSVHFSRVQEKVNRGMSN